jgi:hypothetical protein
MIRKNESVTDSERFLNALCERTFLSLWSYPSIFRDQRVRGRGDGKEICDAFVIFGHDIIVLSDKACSPSASRDPVVRWRRWFSRAIESAAEQCWGAERWIREHPDRLFLDRACTEKFPLPLPDITAARFHLVIVARGIAAESGGLALSSEIRAFDAHKSRPFIIGDLDPDRTFVHVFDDRAVEVVLQTVDTAADFVGYLNRRAAVLRSRSIVAAGGEPDLLATYLSHMSSEADEHDFRLPVTGPVLIEEGSWGRFSAKPERLAQLEADNISYVWDQLIEEFAAHAWAGTQYHKPNDPIPDTEQILRFMASENRFTRRWLAKTLLQIAFEASSDDRRTRYVRSLKPGRPYYVFCKVRHKETWTYEEYRRIRLALLKDLLPITKQKFADVVDVVGIAFDHDGRSFDAAYFDARSWTKDDDERAARRAKEIDALQSPVETPVEGDEYPRARSRHIVIPPEMRIAPWELCPCRSGEFFSMCHGSKYL